MSSLPAATTGATPPVRRSLSAASIGSTAGTCGTLSFPTIRHWPSLFRRQRQVLVPLPVVRRSDHGRQIRVARLPSEQAMGARRIRDQNRRIAAATAAFDRRKLPVRGAADLFDDLAYGETFLRAEIERRRLAALAQILERAHMRIGKVRDMDIVAHRRAV